MSVGDVLVDINIYVCISGNVQRELMGEICEKEKWRWREMECYKRRGLIISHQHRPLSNRNAPSLALSPSCYLACHF